MTTRRRLPIFRHLAAYLVLSLLDLHRALRRVAGPVLVRAVVGVLGVMLLGLVVTSLVALRRVAQSTQMLTSDAMVGVESAVAMRTVAREAQLELLRVRTEPALRLDANAVTRLEAAMRPLLAKYHSGVQDEDDAANALAVETRLEEFVRALRPLLEVDDAPPAAIIAADQAARRLVESVEAAYQFNRERMRITASEAQDAAERALRVAQWMWAVFAAFLLGLALTYGAARWLAVPEDPNS